MLPVGWVVVWRCCVASALLSEAHLHPSGLQCSIMWQEVALECCQTATLMLQVRSYMHWLAGKCLQCIQRVFVGVLCANLFFFPQCSGCSECKLWAECWLFFWW